jgi:hypothetical protein
MLTITDEKIASPLYLLTVAPSPVRMRRLSPLRTGASEDRWMVAPGCDE